jgi:hypothetical protein
MKTATYTVTAINQRRYTWVFTECEPDPNDYGNGTYIAVEHPSGDVSFIDCRYIVGYQFEETCVGFLGTYYGSNLQELQKA